MTSDHFAKLYATILDSSIWSEDHPTVRLWITMLLMADSTGYIEAAIPGLAGRARITLKECETALDKFQKPDTYSKNQDQEGRRIEKVDRGWQLINYQAYRDMRTESQVKRAERQARWRERKKQRLGWVHSGLDAEDEVRWLEILEFYGGRCAYCETNPWSEFDHVIPRARGGGEELGNRVPACRSCNAAKNDNNWRPKRSHPYLSTVGSVDGVDASVVGVDVQKGEGKREKGDTSTTTTARDDFREKLTPEGREAFDGLIAASASPASFSSECAMILAGERQIKPRPTPEGVSLALCDLRTNGRRPEARAIRAYVADAMRHITEGIDTTRSAGGHESAWDKAEAIALKRDKDAGRK